MSKGEDFEMGCHLGDDNVIHITMHGNMSEDHIEEVQTWADSVRETMRECAERSPDRVLTLIDAVGLRETDAKAIGVLQKLIEHNKHYATRTAVFGPGFFHRIILETALKRAGRDNMSVFKTKEEAEKWLFEKEK